MNESLDRHLLSSCLIRSVEVLVFEIIKPNKSDVISSYNISFYLDTMNF